jgi:hypothetical protein
LNVQGIGSSDTIKSVVYDDSGEKVLCASPKTLSYGKIECKTSAVVIPAGTPLKIKTNDNVDHQCANTDVTKCQYQQKSASMPAFSAAVITDSSTITLTGTDFFTTSQYKAEVLFGGIKADTVVVSSATSIVATFAKGVPVVPTPAVPVLRFKEDKQVTVTSIDGNTVTNNRRILNP